MLKNASRVLASAQVDHPALHVSRFEAGNSLELEAHEGSQVPMRPVIDAEAHTVTFFEEVYNDGFRVVERTFPIQFCDDLTDEDGCPMYGYADWGEDPGIVISTQHDKGTQLLTLMHEIGHVYLGLEDNLMQPAHEYHVETWAQQVCKGHLSDEVISDSNEYLRGIRAEFEDDLAFA